MGFQRTFGLPVIVRPMCLGVGHHLYTQRLFLGEIFRPIVKTPALIFARGLFIDVPFPGPIGHVDYFFVLYGGAKFEIFRMGPGQWHGQSGMLPKIKSFFRNILPVPYLLSVPTIGRYSLQEQVVRPVGIELENLLLPPQERVRPFKGVGLPELHVAVPVAPLDVDRAVIYRGDSREIAICLFVTSSEIVLAGGQELVVEVQDVALPFGRELSGPQQQGDHQAVHPVVDAQLVSAPPQRASIR